MTFKKFRYVIYAPTFDENNGGAIALHRLCDLLNSSGVESCIYPMKPHFRGLIPSQFLNKVAVAVMEKILVRKFRTFYAFNTPLCLNFNPRNDIAIYPEVTIGNPLGANKVVRWLLHNPGYFVNDFLFGENDLFFYYQKAFLNKTSITNIGGALKIIYFHEAYKVKHNYSRDGTCYILRKGENRSIVHNLNDSVLIDGLSHVEIADIFNRTRTCISYDMYTMYSRYAAACGCLSIVVPDPAVDKYHWHPEEELRWGIAYGFNDVEWAKETQNKVLPSLLNQEKNINKASVVDFIEKCELYFSNHSQ